jgi:hypothetical protein
VFDCRSKGESCIVLHRNKGCSRDCDTSSCTLRYKVGGLLANRQFTDCQQFETNVSVSEKKRPRFDTVRTPANIEAVRVALIRSPNKSTRRASAELGISRRSLQRILHSDLHIFPYKITVMHKLTAIDKERRLQFALWAMEDFTTHGLQTKPTFI